MGQNADEMADGITCCLCGQYFQGESENELHDHGYPAVCWECWDNSSKRERKKYQRSEVRTIG